MALIGLRCGGLEWFGYPPFFGTQATYAQIQTHTSNTAFSLPTEHELIGNMKLTLREMINIVKEMGIKAAPEKWNDWRKKIADAKEGYDQRVLARTEPMRGHVPVHPDLMGREISEFLHEELKDDYYSIIDGFTAASYYSDWIKVKFATSILDASDVIGFGHAPGMALGCHMAVRGTDREKPMIAIMGDGAIGACGMDIDTCVRWDVPVVFVHMNNNQIVGGMQHFWKYAVWKATGDRPVSSQL